MVATTAPNPATLNKEKFNAKETIIVTRVDTGLKGPSRKETTDCQGSKVTSGISFEPR